MYSSGFSGGGGIKIRSSNGPNVPELGIIRRWGTRKRIWVAFVNAMDCENARGARKKKGEESKDSFYPAKTKDGGLGPYAKGCDR